MNNDKVKSIVKNVSFWSMFVVLGIILLFILMEAIIPNQTINVFQVKTYIAKYDTMEPKIKPNDLVFINKVKPENLEEGDLITFTADINYDGDTEMVTYYIDSIAPVANEDYYRVTVISEGSTVPFGVISSDRIIGGYAFRLPVLGSIIEFVKSPFGIGAIVINILIISGIVIIVKQGKTPEVKEVEENKEVEEVKEIKKTKEPELKEEIKEPKNTEEPTKVKKEVKEVKK
jgi:signal peptidase